MSESHTERRQKPLGRQNGTLILQKQTEPRTLCRTSASTSWSFGYTCQNSVQLGISYGHIVFINKTVVSKEEEANGWWAGDRQHAPCVAWVSPSHPHSEFLWQSANQISMYISTLVLFMHEPRKGQGNKTSELESVSKISREACEH